MATVVGTLQVNVETGKSTLSFEDAKGQLKTFSSQAKTSGAEVDGATTSIRTQLGLLDNTIRGAHAQAMADLIRKFSDSAIVMKALPIAATGAAFVLVGALGYAAIEKITTALAEAKTKLSTFNLAWAESASTSVDKLGNLYVEILKLRDETAKLYGKVPTNGLAVAAVEALTKIIALDKGIVTTITDMEKLMKEQSVGFFEGLFTGQSGTADMSASLKPMLDAAKSTYAEVLNAEAQLELDLVNKASKSAIEADKAIIASKKSAAAAALVSLQQETSAQQKSIQDQIDSRTKLHTIETEYGKITTPPENLEKVKEEYTVRNQILSGIKMQTTSLQAQLGLENALTQAEREHGTAVDAHAASEAARKALLERIKSIWHESEAAVKGYVHSIDKAHEAESKLGKGGKGVLDPKDLDVISAVDPVLGAILRSTKAENEELGKWDGYLDKVAASERNLAKARSEDKLTDDINPIDEQIKAYKRLASEGLISQQQLAANLKSLYQQEADDKIASLNEELKFQKDAQAEADMKADVTGSNEALIQQLRLQREISNVTKQNEEEQAQLDAETTKLANHWTDYFAKMKASTLDLGTTFRGTLQHDITQFQTSFASAMSRSIVEGKNFGQAMRQVAAQFLETGLSALIQWLEKWIISHVIAAAVAHSTSASTFAAQKTQAVSLAGANAVASFALAPWPIDMGAPAFGAAMSAAALAMNKGGVVPGTGTGDTVPAMLTPGEGVLPKPLMDRLSESTGSSSGSTYHIHYSPTNHLKAWDGSDVRDMLAQHKEEFVKHAVKEIRRRHK